MAKISRHAEGEICGGDAQRRYFPRYRVKTNVFDTVEGERVKRLTVDDDILCHIVPSLIKVGDFYRSRSMFFVAIAIKKPSNS
jgi:hypothetical protein